MSIPLVLMREADLAKWVATQGASTAHWISAHGFAAERARTLAIPAPDGSLQAVLGGLGAVRDEDLNLWHAAALTEKLPPGRYHLEGTLPRGAATQFLLGSLVGQYRFTHLRTNAARRDTPCVDAPAGADVRYATAAADALAGARDLINQPANLLGPEELAAHARRLAEQFGGACAVELVDSESRDERVRASGAKYPLLEAVGRGSPRTARMIELRWGDPAAPAVTLIGKGVCFDSGGLDLKPSAAMLLMKKDMGGAACALGCARLLMQLKAPICLRVLIPAVENSLDGRSFRPGDVFASRKGLTVEIGNTDAEGRLILADALALADETPPALLVDFATLTGAARVALGPELPAAFSPDANLLADFVRCAHEEHDPAWPMPLWEPYEDELASKIADLANVSAAPFAGAVIAALFLKRFVTASPAWLHLDLYAWNAKDRPGRPVGGEAQCVRAVYRFIRQRFG